MRLASRAGLSARIAGPGDMAQVMALRGQAFRGDPARDDRDAFDARCLHVVVEAASGLRSGPRSRSAPLACFRVLPLAGGGAARASYSAQFYDLSGLSRLEAPMLEIGRFCIAPRAAPDPDILRIAWGALAALVQRHGAKWLFGCSSFPGTDPRRWHESFALLARRHLLAPPLAPGRRALRTVPLAGSERRLPAGRDGAAAHRRALAGLPPLLRSYLNMGGRVSDHAVIDPELSTLHVFTLLEVAAIPRARLATLRALAGSGP